MEGRIEVIAPSYLDVIVARGKFCDCCGKGGSVADHVRFTGRYFECLDCREQGRTPEKREG